MTGIMLYTCSRTCQADTTCDRIPCFQAHLDAPRDARRPRIQMRTAACACHVGTVVVAMTAWARERDLTNAKLTVLTIQPPRPEWHPAPRPQRCWAQTSGLVFSVIHLDGKETGPCDRKASNRDSHIRGDL
jgi:hypothetical protein